MTIADLPLRAFAKSFDAFFAVFSFLYSLELSVAEKNPNRKERIKGHAKKRKGFENDK